MRRRYVPAHWRHKPRWKLYHENGDRWKGFGGVPYEYELYSAGAHTLFRDMLERFLRHPEVLEAAATLTPEERLEALQDDTLVSPNGVPFDEYFYRWEELYPNDDGRCLETFLESSPEGFEGGLDAEATAQIDAYTFPNGCHVAEVEVDPETGVAEIVNYVAVDDFGVVLNPMLVAGQVHGGVVQGIGQALYEHAVYDDNGQLLSGSFMDYCMPRADGVPAMQVSTIEVPCKNNPMGVKGCGEAGSVASPAAVINAIIDALADLGVTSVDMPATPQSLWRLIQQHRQPIAAE